MANMLMGAFDTSEAADRALRELEEKGYTPEQISVISEKNSYKAKGYDTGDDIAHSAGTGAAAGSVVGGLAGLLAGIGMIPAITGLFIGGPIVAALGLAGAAAATAAGAVTGAAAGGLIGALSRIGVSEDTAAIYETAVKKGGVVLGLTGHEEITDEARRIMEQNGAKEVSLIDMKETAMAHESEMRDRPVGRPQPVFGERRETPEELRRAG